ncbi:MAG TPA: NAD(P)-binding domain-containing protein [Pseudonocardia sp.]|nr:NAD(P)-binding domain-containing protein [Pseudonocardia sp.]
MTGTSTTVDTVVVGAGQAGLALSRCLTDRGREHVLLERGRVAERWHSERWDSFRLLTPNWHTRLPGWGYHGPDPDGFMDRTEVQRFFTSYARSFDAPVRTGVTVTRVRPADDGWSVRTDGGDVHARNVVVATGHMDRPAVPATSAALPGDVVQLHSSRYRNPGQLPDGGVLVVGAGPSGQQIADELALSGRRVHIAVGRHQVLPRRYRGRDPYWWLERTGALRRTVDELSRPRTRLENPVLTGGRSLDLRVLARHGVVPHGRLLGVGPGGRLCFADDLALSLRAAEDHTRRFRDRVDDHVARTGLDAPPEPPPPSDLPRWAWEAATALDLRAAGVRSVVWATGYRRDYSWLDAPVLDPGGVPVQRRGVTAAPGLFFLGLWFMWRRDSSSIDGVGADAEYLAERIAARAAPSAA